MERPQEDIQFHYDKFRAAVRLVCAKCGPDALGRVKLHKILYFADFLRFLETGEPLTGEEYLKQQFGPTARHLNKALRDLEREGALEIKTVPFHGYVKYEFKALRDLKTNLLSDSEAALLSDVADFVCGKTASQISEFSHEGPWEAVETGDRIPYFMAFSLLPNEVTDEDRDWAAGEAKALGLVA